MRWRNGLDRWDQMKRMDGADRHKCICDKAENEHKVRH